MLGPVVAGRRALLIATASVLLGACGGVATNGGQTKADGPVKEVLIGAPYPLSGTWANFGKNAVDGMQAAADVINAAGGIQELDGAKVRIVSADTSDDPAQAQAVTAKMIQDKGVVALVGSYLSNLSLTTSTAAESARVPMITQSFVDQLTGRDYKYLFQLPPKSSTFGTEAVRFALEIAESQTRQIKRAAIVSSNDAAGKAQADAVVVAARAAGITVDEPIVYPPGVTDATPIVSRVQSSKPDIVFSYGPVSDTTLIVRNLRERGVEAPIMGTGGTGLLDKGISTSLGALSEGLLSLSAWNDDMDLPGVEEAARAYKKAVPDAPFMPQEAGESYVAVRAIVEAVKAADSAAPQAIRDALAKADLTGGPAAAMPAGHVTFDDTGMNEHAMPLVVQWRGGRPVTVWPKDIAAAPVK